MKKVILLGTVHGDFTPRKELIKEVEKHKPDQLFIELTQQEVSNGKEESIRKEMFYVLEYAIENKIPYILFDIDESCFKDEISENEIEQASDWGEILEYFNKFSWQELNNRAPNEIKKIKELKEEDIDKYFDRAKIKSRESKIEKNIITELIDGTNVVVTGNAHLTHMLSGIPNSFAPLRTD